MKIYKRRCHYRSKLFTINDFLNSYCDNQDCKESRLLLEIDRKMDRLTRLITPKIITTETGRRNLKENAEHLINRNKNRYLSIKNLPKGPNGMTAKFDVLKREITYKTFDDLQNNR